jgi:hypothetical protein
VGNLISVPFQNNTNLNAGPLKGTQNILNIQPVIPISVDEQWNIITRTIIPVISNPAFAPGDERVNGVGDIQVSAMLSPANPGEWIWGAGAITQLPTNTNAALGNNNLGLGPSFVVLHLEKGNPWVYGMLINNVWSVTSDHQGGSYNNGVLRQLQPAGRGLPHHVAGQYRQLEGRERPAMDRAAGWWHRQDFPLRQAAGEPAGRRLLQRRAAGRRTQLAGPRPGAVHVPEVACSADAFARTGRGVRRRPSEWTRCHRQGVAGQLRPTPIRASRAQHSKPCWRETRRSVRGRASASRRHRSCPLLRCR